MMKAVSMNGGYNVWLLQKYKMVQKKSEYMETRTKYVKGYKTIYYNFDGKIWWSLLILNE